MSFDPTTEQRAALDAFADGKGIVLEAGAGTGKTTTLNLLASSTKRRGVYIAYNKAIATEAAEKFPSNVVCKTAHAFAFAAVGREYRDRLGGPRVPVWDVAKNLRINTDLDFGDRILTKNTQARIALDTVANFCRSADLFVTRSHVPFQEGLDAKQAEIVRAKAEIWARTIWDDLLQKSGGRFKFDHDHYLKIWQLSGPDLASQFILFDEAQDANPLIASIVERQDAQKVYVGDSAQAIYGWNGAVDALKRFAAEADAHLYLSESFRYGQGIADEGNRYLELLGTPLRLTGRGPESEIRECPDADAVLCRTNAGAMQVVLSSLAAEQSVHLVGGSTGLERFVKGAHDLKVKGSSSHPDLCVFKSWHDVQDYVTNDPGGSDLKTMVGLVDTHGTEVLLGALARCTSEQSADVVVSTAHKAKGREWDSVRIGSDFEPKGKKAEFSHLSDELSDADLMLRYVAVTRSKRVLDVGPLVPTDTGSFADLAVVS